MWQVSQGASGGYLDNLLRRLCGFLKVTAPTLHQTFEPETLESESQCSSTELSWDLYVKGGDNVFNA